ncbi:hypothetical protein F4821DRAFT_255114 [Hypoxylon rubiginosum]|uniref:Uncharacterized protein n=1 Tax=Hypoxylon rubiginosum TaxID=110542 RepID=A0ACC0DF23_9PEZI|nr:hypothetical protein F4821DRAFT_255114 [Hypoxylon rubiginosum]
MATIADSAAISVGAAVSASTATIEQGSVDQVRSDDQQLALVRHFLPVVKDRIVDLLNGDLDYYDLAPGPRPRPRRMGESERADTKKVLRPIFEVLYPQIFRILTPLAQGLGPASALKQPIYEASEIALGIHDKYQSAFGSKFSYNNNDVLSFKDQHRPTSGGSDRSFTLFGQLFMEIKGMIWEEALHSQNRVVTTDKLRRIIHAPCPPLFLVNRETYLWVLTFYNKIKASARGRADLVTGRVAPACYKFWEGPVISYKYDIFDIGEWNVWGSLGKSPVVEDVFRQLNAGERTRPIVKNIIDLRDKQIRRLATHWHSRRLELLFYQDALENEFVIRNENGLHVKTKIEWQWAWAKFVNEIWVVQHTNVWCNSGPENAGFNKQRYREHLTRVFPPSPGQSCTCTLCTSYDTLGKAVVKYEKPGPTDFDGHSRIFEEKDDQGNWKRKAKSFDVQWPQNVPRPEYTWTST